jgi:hypothetical protein
MEESDTRYKSLEQELDDLRTEQKRLLERMDAQTNSALLKLYERSDSLRM